MRYDPNLTRPKKPAIRVKRQPIIAQDLFNEMDFTELGNQPLANINGPSVIRVPNWVTHRFGEYYLYFAHHKGTSIRLAYADQITGPWRMHKKPVLSLEHSLFVSQDLDPETRRDWVNGPDYLYAHVASPDVHVDHQNKQIVMFFHGLMPDGDQQSRLSSSSNRLSFTAAPPLLGPSYLRAFRWQDRWYSTHLWGDMGVFETLLHAPRLIPHTQLPPQITGTPTTKIRHGQICRVGDQTHFVFSRVGDRPERILHCRIALAPHPNDWCFGPTSTLLLPEETWEGFG